MRSLEQPPYRYVQPPSPIPVDAARASRGIVVVLICSWPGRRSACIRHGDGLCAGRYALALQNGSLFAGYFYIGGRFGHPRRRSHVSLWNLGHVLEIGLFQDHMMELTTIPTTSADRRIVVLYQLIVFQPNGISLNQLTGSNICGTSCESRSRP